MMQLILLVECYYSFYSNIDYPFKCTLWEIAIAFSAVIHKILSKLSIYYFIKLKWNMMTKMMITITLMKEISILNKIDVNIFHCFFNNLIFAFMRFYGVCIYFVLPNPSICKIPPRYTKSYRGWFSASLNWNSKVK